MFYFSALLHCILLKTVFVCGLSVYVLQHAETCLVLSREQGVVTCR